MERKFVSILIVIMLMALSQVVMGSPLSWDELEKQQKATNVSHEHLSPPDFFKPAKAVEVRASKYALVSVKCSDPRTCSPYAALLSGSPMSFETTKSVDLPQPHKAYQYKVFPTIVSDFNGDQMPELLARYEIITTPRPAEGSLFYDYLAILRLEDLSLLGFIEIGKTGNGSTDPDCTVAIDVSDADGDSLRDIHILETCSLRRCRDFPNDPECQNPKVLDRGTLYWHKNEGKYLSVKNTSNLPNDTLVDIAKPDTPAMPDRSTKAINPPPPPAPWFWYFVVGCVALLIICLIIVKVRRA